MKKIIVAITLLMTVFTLFGKTHSVEKKLEWFRNIEEAVSIAQEKELNVLVDFTGSDWCHWCIKLDEEVFSQKEFISYAKDNLVLVKLDFPRNQNLVTEEEKIYNRDKANKFGIQGFPTILLMDSNGVLIGKTGYQAGGAVNYTKHLESIINK